MNIGGNGKWRVWHEYFVTSKAMAADAMVATGDAVVPKPKDPL